MPHWFIVTLFCAAPLLTSGEGHAAPADTPPAFDAIERFEESIPHNLLRGLYDQALAALHEYIEIEGNLPGDGETQARAGEFSLRLFPRGKSAGTPQRRGIVPPLTRTRTTGVLASLQILQTPAGASDERRDHLAA